jgi:hypothetical protein
VVGEEPFGDRVEPQLILRLSQAVLLVWEQLIPRRVLYSTSPVMPGRGLAGKPVP